MTQSLLWVGIPSASMFPVVRELVEREYELILGPSPLEAHARTRGVKVRDPNEFLTGDLLATVESQTRRVSTQLADAFRLARTPAGTALFQPELTIEHRRALHARLVDLASRQIQVLESFEGIRKRTALAGVVFASCVDPAHRALALACRRSAVPSFLLPAGVTPLARSDILPEFLGVPGACARQSLIDAGFPALRLFDALIPHSPDDDLLRSDDRRSQRLQLGLDPDRPVILYAAPNVGFRPALLRRNIEGIRRLIAAVADIPRAQILLVASPEESPQRPVSPADQSRLQEPLMDWARREGATVTICCHDDPRTLLTMADVVVHPPVSWAADAARDFAVPAVSIDRLADLPLAFKRPSPASGPPPNVDSSASSAAIAMHERMQNARRSRGRARLALRGRSNLKILLAAHDFFPFGKAGTERYTRDLAHALGRQGHHVRILAPRADLPEKQACFLQEEIAEGIAVGRLHVPVSAMAAPRVESMIPAVADFLGRHSFDVVHLQHFMGLGPVLVDLVKQRGIPLVATANDFFSACEQIHLMLPTGLPCVGPETVDKCVQCAQVRYGLKEEQIPDQFFRIADRRLTFKRMIAKLDLLVCPSQFLKRIYEQYGFIAPRTVHLPQGADLRPPLPRSPRNDQNIVVTYLGHIAYRKGLDLLVRAFNEADTDRAELRIFGINSEPRYFQQVMASIRPGKRVTYGGEYTADQMPGILAQTDVAVVPSRGENYPFVIREILHHRVPVVAASVAGVPEIVHDGVNGRLFPPGDHDKLRSILQEILAGPDTLDRWRAGITPIRSMDEDAREIELLYADLLADRAQRDSINIVQVRPTPQSPIASSAGRLLAGAFTEAGLATTTSVNRMSAADAHLFIGFDAVESTDGMKHVHKIAFQHEPLKLSDRIPGSTLVERLRRAQEVWTFIADDAHWLAEQGIAARTLPLGSAGPRINAGNLDRDLDVLVLSAVGPMHEVILKQLEHFCEVTRVKNAPDGILRDLFRRTKIVLALADPAASSLDLLRVVEAWSAGALVVTDTTSPVDLSGPLVQVESAVLAQLVWRLLSDTDLAHEQHQKVEAWLAERRLGDALRTWLREPAQMIQLNFAATL